MTIDPGFDPIFNTAPTRRDEDAGTKRSKFLFDGWSYEPLAEQQDRSNVDAKPQR